MRRSSGYSREAPSGRSSQRSFDNEEYADLPVPRRKTNTLSILRKLMSEYDGVPLEDSDSGRGVRPQRKEYQIEDEKADIPDHCWVGEFLDDSGEDSKDVVPISYDTNVVNLGYGRPNLPRPASPKKLERHIYASSNSPESSLHLRELSQLNPHKLEPHGMSEEEMEDMPPQRRYRAVYHDMIKSLEYTDELEELQREADRRKKSASAKVFDYGHGERTEKPDRHKYQSRASEPDIRNLTTSSMSGYAPDHNRAEGPLGSRSRRMESNYYQPDEEVLEDRKTRLEGSLSPCSLRNVEKLGYELNRHRHRKIEEKEVETHLAEKDKRQSNLRQGIRDAIHRPGKEKTAMISVSKRRVDKTKLPYDGYHFQDVDDLPQLKKPGRKEATSEFSSSYGRLFSRSEKNVKDSGSQSYESFLDQLQARVDSKQPKRRQDEETSSGINKGLPIAVLTTGYRKRELYMAEDEDNRYESHADDALPGLMDATESSEERKMLKIKPVLKNIHKGAFKNEQPERVLHSPETTKEVNRMFQGSFNDTRKVLLDEDIDEKPRRDKMRGLGTNSRLVVESNTLSRAMSDESNVASGSRHRQKGSLAGTDAGISRSVGSKFHGAFPFGSVNEDEGDKRSEESEDSDTGQLLHLQRPTALRPGRELHDNMKMSPKPNSRKSYDDQFSVESHSFASQHVRDPPHGDSDRSRRRFRDDQSRSANSRKSKFHSSEKRSSIDEPRIPRPRSPIAFHGSRKSQPTTSRTRDKSMTKLGAGHVEHVPEIYHDIRSSRLTYEDQNVSSSSNSRERFDGNFNLEHDQDKEQSREYIDQFFERQIRIWEGSNLETKPESRMVVRAHPKTKTLWEEEVDRYVNRPAGRKRRNSVEFDQMSELEYKFEPKRKHKSRSPPSRHKRGAPAHGKNERKYLQLSPDELKFHKGVPPSVKADICGISQKAAGDERRFEERSSYEYDNRMSSESMIMDRPSFKLTDIRRTIRQDREHRKDEERDSPSTSAQQKRRRLLNRGQFDTPSKPAQNMPVESRHIVREKNEKYAGYGGTNSGRASAKAGGLKKMQSPSKKQIAANTIKRPPTGAGTSLKIVDRGGMSGSHAAKSAPNNWNATRMKKNEVKGASGRDETIMPLLLMKIPEPQGYKESLHKLSQQANKDAATTSTGGKYGAKNMPVKKEQRINRSASKAFVSGAKLSVQKKGIPEKRKSTDIKKETVGVVDTHPIKGARKLINRDSEGKTKGDKILLKRNLGHTETGKEDDAKSTHDGGDALPSTKKLVKENTRDWLPQFQKWFSDVMQEILSNEEQAKEWGLHDPMRFLESVTLGHKRSMSYIPRGHAKEMLRFIALNKKFASNAKTQKQSYTQLKTDQTTVDKDSAEHPETQSRGKMFVIDKSPSIAHMDQKKEELEPRDSSQLSIRPQHDGQKKTNSLEDKPSNNPAGIVEANQEEMGDKGKDIDMEDQKQEGTGILMESSHNEEVSISTKSEAGIKETVNVSTNLTTTVSPGLPQQLDSEKEKNPSHEAIVAKESLASSTAKTSTVTSKAKFATSTAELKSRNTGTSSTTSKELKAEPSKSCTSSGVSRQRSNSGRQPSKATKSRKQSTGKVQPEPAKAEVTQTSNPTAEDHEGIKEKKDQDQKPKTVQSRKRSTQEFKGDRNNSGGKSAGQSNKRTQEGGKPKSSYSKSDKSKSHRQDAPIKDLKKDPEIPSKEPFVSSKQANVLPEFKKQVERTALRSLNVLYNFGSFKKYKLIKAAKDALDSFSVINHSSFGFTVEHALYYLSSLFTNPTADCLDDAHRQLRKSHLMKPLFDVDLETFFAFQKSVNSLCKENLNPNIRYSAQDQIKKRYVRQRAEYLFPQFDGETDAVVKLWMWSERMHNNLHKDSGYHSSIGKLPPFPEDQGETMEDRVGEWLKDALRRHPHDESDSYCSDLMSAVKTQLMKTKSHATKQEAMALIARAWMKSHFNKIEMRHKSKEAKKIHAEDEGDDSEELMVLDEVYSDESEEEKEELDIDLVEDSGGVQIDLF